MSTIVRLKHEMHDATVQFSRMMQRRYDAMHVHLSNHRDDPVFDHPVSIAVHPELFTLKSKKCKNLGGKFRKNKYGVTDLTSIYGEAAPKKLVHGSSKCMALSHSNATAKAKALKSQLELCCRSSSRNGHCTLTYTICVDTGCSITITNCLDDFESPPQEGTFGDMKTIDGTSEIKAFGIVNRCLFL
jgi:hypothetical protein